MNGREIETWPSWKRRQFGSRAENRALLLQPQPPFLFSPSSNLFPRFPLSLSLIVIFSLADWVGPDALLVVIVNSGNSNTLRC